VDGGAEFLLEVAYTGDVLGLDRCMSEDEMVEVRWVAGGGEGGWSSRRKEVGGRTIGRGVLAGMEC